MKAAILSLLFMLSSAAAMAEDVSPADKMADYDSDYYLRIFDYVMDNVRDETPYQWQANSGKGSIKVGKEYMSKSKIVCRDFSESYIINKEQGTAAGAGCKRVGREGWCRVKHSDAHTCALEKTRPGSGQVIDGAGELLKNAGDWLR